MKVVKRIGIALVLLLAAFFIGVYSWLQTTKPLYSGELTLKGLKDSVAVHFDSYGVPHIYATSMTDAYFALGYVHAQDRLFQMEMLRRAAGGRLSEVLGKDLLPVDKLFRTLGLTVFAREHATQFLSGDSSDFQRATHAYQDGVNEFVRTGTTPVEFSIIGIPKTEFKSEDIYLALAFMSFGFAEGIKADPVLEKIKQEFGPNYLKDLAIQTPPDAFRIRNFRGTPKPSPDRLIASIHDAISKIPVPMWSGSNGWVIAGNRTKSGFPILGNDTHIGFGQPAVWYEAHLEYPGYRFYGHFLAGVPFALLGNNKFCGWGLTMFENDDADFFYETVNPKNPVMVKFEDSWEVMDMRDEVIHIKGGPDLTLTVSSSRHGPIINSIMNDVLTGDSTPVALYWQPMHKVSQTLQAVYALNHAESLQDVQKVLPLFSAPGLNIMYGDVDGNIAWWAVGALPIRPSNVSSMLFLDGASGKEEYLGFYDFSKNPQALNPPWGFVYSANNQPDSVNDILYPGYYYPRSRSERIVELLQQEKKWTMDDVKKVNLDVLSHMHKDIASLLAQALPSEHADVAAILEAWDGNHGLEDIAPSVYYNLLSQTIYLAMMDELGPVAFDALMGTAVPKNSYYILIRNENSPWWDNVRTKDKKESRLDIVGEAAFQTKKLLNKTSGSSPSEWQWKKIHSLTHEHPLGSVKPLDKVFNVGPFPVPGGSETINNLNLELDTTGYFRVAVGPALRKITDFGDLENGVTVSPTGQSGNFMSPHYDDEAEMFATGQFRKMMMNRNEISGSARKLKLLPSH